MIKTTSAQTDYALSGNLESGSVNIWSTGMGLNLCGGFNFKKQAHTENTNNLDKEKLEMLKMSKVVHGDANLYLKSIKFLGEKSYPQEEK